MQNALSLNLFGEENQQKLKKKFNVITRNRHKQRQHWSIRCLEPNILFLRDIRLSHGNLKQSHSVVAAPKGAIHVNGDDTNEILSLYDTRCFF